MLALAIDLKQKNQIQESIEKSIKTILQDVSNKSEQTYNFLTIKHLKINYTRSKLLISLLQNNNRTADFIINYCVVIELLHIAAQLHSVIESPAMQNSKKLSIEQIVLIGDLLFTLAFEQMLNLDSNEVLEHFAATTQEMSQNEAALSEYSGTDINTLTDLIERKYWPLFNSILFFYEFLESDNLAIDDQHDRESYLKKFNKEYVQNKIKSKNLLIPARFTVVL